MLEQNDCPICGDSGRSFWGNTAGYDIVRCVSCGLGITSPFPGINELKESNDGIYSVEERGQLYLRKQNYYSWRYRAQLRRIKQYVPSGRLLDIGCNIGLFLNCAREAGFDAEGIELNHESAAFARSHFKLNVHTSPIEEINFPEETFDVITMYDVLEHIPKPQDALDVVHRILKPGGLLIVQSPNIDSLMARLTVSHWCWLTPPDHLYHFTPTTMRRILTEKGFDIVESRTWEPTREFSSNLIASWNERGFIPKIIRAFLRDLRIIWLPTLIFQRLWWHRQLGGLIEITASKMQS